MNKNLEALILSCLAKNPDERPSARDISSRLADISEERTPGKTAVAAAAAGGARSRPKNRTQTPRRAAAPSAAPPSRGGRSRGIFAALAVVAVLALLSAMVGPSLLGGGGSEENAAQDEAPQQSASQQGGDASSSGSGNGGDASSSGAASGGGQQEAAETPAAQDPVAEDPVEPDPVEEAPVESAPAEEDPVEEAPEEPSGGGLSEGAAADVVEGFYTTAADGDYGSSAEYLGAGGQSTFPNEGTFEGTFATLESIRFIEGPEVQISGGAATVTGVTEAVHTDRVEQNMGTWTLVNVGGEWKLNGFSVQPI